MRKLSLVLMTLLVFSLSLSAEVYKTTKEITGYKENGSSSSQQDVENVTITLLNPSEVSFEDGTDIPVPESYRNKAYTAFYWSITGNLYNGISVSFEFTPMYLGALSQYGSVSITEKNTVIPYTVVLYHTQTSVTDGSTTRTIGTNAITSADKSTAFDTGVNYRSYYSNYDVYINYADKVTVNNPSAISTSSSSGSITYNMATNSYAWYEDYWDDANEYNYTSTTCNTWTRTGNAVVTLKINDDGSWVDDSDVIVDSGSFKAYVTVTIATT